MKDFQSLNVTDYFHILSRRMWYFAVTFALVSAGTAIAVWKMPSIYKSETSILVTSRFLPEDYIGSIVRDSNADRIEFVKQQLHSRTFAEKIVQEFQLVPTGGNIEGSVTAVVNNIDITMLSTNSFKLAFTATDPNIAQAVTRRLAERVMQLNDALRKERVNVADQFLDQQVRQAADELAQVEEKMRRFNQQYFPGVPEQGVNSDVFNTLQTQFAAVQADLDKDLDQRKAYERMLNEQQQLKVATQAPITQVRAVTSSSLQTAASTPSVLEQKLAGKRTELAAAASKYTPLHPDVSRLAREVRELESQVNAELTNHPAPVQRVPEGDGKDVAVTPLPEIDVSVDFYQAEIRREMDQLDRGIQKTQETKNNLASKLASYQRRVNAPPIVLQELSELNKQHDAAKERYNYISTRALNSDLAGKVDTDASNVTFRVIDPANLPQFPIKPDRRMLAALGCLAGLVLGLGIAFMREYLDPTLIDDEAASAELKLPVLTSIPKVDISQRGKRKLNKERQVSNSKSFGPEFDVSITADGRVRSVILDPLTVAGEQFRVMRAHLSMMQKQRGSKSILVVSAIPNEGKTFTACCLAGILAQEQGKKVLLIDADLRTATACLMLGLSNKPSIGGLCDILRSKANVEEGIIDYDDFALSFLPSGASVENPAELLSSPRLESLLHHVKSIFDWVIVDSPPSLALADANLLASVCDTTLLVVRAEKTPVNLIKDSIQRIGRDKICGVVMNRVRKIKFSYYYNQVQQSKANH